MLDKSTKDKLIRKFQTHGGDTGSPQVQIAILTEEIKFLVEHLKTHRKDFSSRRGLLKKVSERRRLMKYLEREDPAAHDDIAKRLKIKVKSAVAAIAEQAAAAAEKAAVDEARAIARAAKATVSTV